MKKEDKDVCIFCKILEGKQESSIVFEDDFAIAIMDIEPINSGHVLIIPKKHVSYINDLDENIGAHLFKIGMRINTAIRKSNIQCDGINYLLSDGETAGQEVFHVHLHVLPRFKNDGFGFHSKKNTQPQKEDLNKIAADIKALL